MAERRLGRELGVIIMAAGKGTRMESDLGKVLHPVAGKPMLAYILRVASTLAPERIAVVIGHGGDQVRQAFSDWPGLTWVRQRKMRGTGDAVKAAAATFRKFDGSVLVLCGDTPRIRAETIRRLVMVHKSSSQAMTLLTAEAEDPTGYGRIVLSGDNSVARIVEENEATTEEKKICEINTGIGVYESQFLFTGVKGLRSNNKKQEYYLTDLVEVARKDGRDVGRLILADASEAIGVNDRAGLAEASCLIFEAEAHRLLRSGVSLEDPTSTFVEPGIQVDRDTFVEHSVAVRGNSRIGKKVRLGAGASVISSQLGVGVQVGAHSSLRQAKIGSETLIGENTTIGKMGD